MHKSIAPISLLALVAASPSQAAPTEIRACGTISQSGSYVLAQNLSVSSGDCLRIAADNVTINLAGFTISCESGGFACNGGGTGIKATAQTVTEPDGLPFTLLYSGATVRNGNIVGFDSGVVLGSRLRNVVEGLRVENFFSATAAGAGIRANGVVKDNQVGVANAGIVATGRVTGNVVNNISVPDPGSTVIGNNVATSLTVSCPANVTDNVGNLVLEGQGCNNTNNVAP